MEKLTSPYLDTEQYSRVSLESYQMNSDVLINLKFNLTKKVEGKCNKDGFVVKVHKIIEHLNGAIQPENFSASAVFDIKYSCKLCLPIENTTIITKVRTINKVLMVAENGPILCIVLANNINQEKFKMSANNGFYSIKKKREIESDDYVKIHIISKTFNFGDNQIKVMGFLNDVATDEEVENYFDENTADNELTLKGEENNEDDDLSDPESDFSDDYIDENPDQNGGGMGSNYII